MCYTKRFEFFSMDTEIHFKLSELVFTGFYQVEGVLAAFVIGTGNCLRFSFNTCQ